MLCCCIEEEQSPGPNALLPPASPASATSSVNRAGAWLCLGGGVGAWVCGVVREKMRGGTVGAHVMD